MNKPSPKFKNKLKRVLFITAGWIVAGLYVSIIQYWSIFMAFNNKHPVDTNLGEVLIATIIEVSFAGLILSSFEVFYFTDRFRKKSFAYAVLMKSLFYATGLAILALGLTYLETFQSQDQYNFFVQNILSILLLTFFIWGPIFLLTAFLLQVNDKYGQAVLLKFIAGKYHSPKEETRLFYVPRY